METNHRVFTGDSRNMEQIGNSEVDLMVTSPPYPMIEMWDEPFSELNSSISESIEKGNGQEAFNLMHSELDKVWSEVSRVLKSGGIACINIGDATRKIGGNFQLFPNHQKVIDFFSNKNFNVLPCILWRKPTNKATKFMGSGMIPPNAYVTLEHEYILIFRKEGPRSFPAKCQKRYESAYFWEERNKWFSDVWTGITGRLQSLEHDELRDRAAAFPLELPYRLINMYSVYKDTVLDPFMGTGTTNLASMISARNSIGVELKEEFVDVLNKEVKDIKEKTESINRKRLERHNKFVKETDKDLSYNAENYDFPVQTKQEKKLKLYSIDEVEKLNKEHLQYNIRHSKYSH